MELQPSLRSRGEFISTKLLANGFVKVSLALKKHSFVSYLWLICHVEVFLVYSKSFSLNTLDMISFSRYFSVYFSAYQFLLASIEKDPSLEETLCINGPYDSGMWRLTARPSTPPGVSQLVMNAFITVSVPSYYIMPTVLHMNTALKS